MKLFFLVVITFFVASDLVRGYESGSIRGGGSTSRTLLAGDDFPGCVEVKDGKDASGTKLILGDCKNKLNGFEEKAGNGTGVYTFYLRKNKKKCMQVNGSSAATIKDGTTLYLRSCKKNERLQVFYHNSGVSLSPIDRKDLCVHHFGATPNIGRDRIVLKNCTRVGDNGDWSFD